MKAHNTRNALCSIATGIITSCALFASPEDFVERGNALMQLSRDEMNPNRYSEAAEFYSEALEIDPENADAMLGLAWVENSNHNFENGEMWAKKAISINDEIVDAYSLIGDSHVEHGEYQEAFENYQQALDLRPDLSTYSRAGHLVWLTGDVQKGMKLLELAISSGGPHAENTAWCRAQLSQMLFHAGQWEASLSIATQAVRDAPENPLVLANMGQIFHAHGKNDAALENFEKSYKIQPTHESLSHLYDLYQEAGRNEDRDRVYQELVLYHQNHHKESNDLDHPEHTHEGHHSHSKASAQLAKFWLDRDLYPDLALAEAKAAQHAYPNINATHTLALAYLKADDTANAERSIQKALEWTPPLAEIYYHAGLIQAALGHDDDAQKYFHTAAELNPKFQTATDETIEDFIESRATNSIAALSH